MDNEDGFLKRFAMKYTRMWLDWALPGGALMATLIVLLVVWRHEYMVAFFSRPLTELTLGDLIFLGAVWGLFFRGVKK